jgi:hypothetical protein
VRRSVRGVVGSGSVYFSAGMTDAQSRAKIKEEA